jgi:hypothetical protein
VISSFGKHPFEIKRRGVSESKNGVEGTMTGVIQKKVDAKTTGWDDDGAQAPVNESKDGNEGGIGTTTPYRKWMG